MEIEVLNPHGFCAGVKGALAKVAALKDVYCLHELVHNEEVIASLKARGFKFVEDIDEVPTGAMVVFSAHGVSKSVRDSAVERRLKVIDTTCPFVQRVHQAVRDFAAKGLPVVVIGDKNHAEVKGIIGETDNAMVYPKLPRARRFAVVSQTTMNADEVSRIVNELKSKYEVETMAEVCTATKERQDAVKNFNGDAILVLGGRQSANTRRLCEVAPCKAYMASTVEEARKIIDSLDDSVQLGVTSGASTPEDFLERVLR